MKNKLITNIITLLQRVVIRTIIMEIMKILIVTILIILVVVIIMIIIVSYKIFWKWCKIENGKMQYGMSK